VDLARREVQRRGRAIDLTPLEVEVLRYLVARPRTPVSRSELLTEVWGYAPNVQSRAVDHTMSRLRAKLEEDPRSAVHLVGVRGFGYRFEPLADPAAAPARVGFPRLRGERVGRESELERLATVLGGRTRAVVLKGPPGVGKTRLAIAFGSRAGGPPAWFFDLEGLESREDLVRSAADALGLPTAGSAVDVGEAVERALASRGRSLVVLDGFDGLVGVGEDDVLRWLAIAPQLLLLITTRRVPDLGVPVVEVHGLDALDALALLEARARARGAALAEDDATRQACRALVSRLEGLPLALELAAARCTIQGPRELLELLDGPGPLLTGLEAALESAWTQLSIPERAALIAAAVFCGPFPLEAFRAVLAPDQRSGALDHLERLRDDSWLVVEPSADSSRPTRFRLPGPLRASVRAHGDAEGPRDRHARWFSDQALAGERDPQRLAAEVSELLAAWRHLRQADGERAVGLALVLARHLRSAGPFDPLLPLLDDALDLEAATGPVRAALHLERGKARRIAGDVGRAEADLVAARDGASVAGLAAAWRSLGNLRRHQGRLEAAEQCYAEAREAASAPGGETERGPLLRDLGSLRLRQERPQEAGPLYDEALDHFRRQGDSWNEGWILGNLGNLHLEAGAIAAARRAYDQALRVHRSRGDHRWEGMVLSNLAMLDLEQGALGRAHETLARALRLHRATGNRRFEGHALSALGALAHENGDLARSRDHQEEALGVFLEVRDNRFEGVARARLAALDAAEGRSGEAAAGFATAREALARRSRMLEAVAVLEAVAAGDPVELPEGATSFARICARLAGPTMLRRS